MTWDDVYRVLRALEEWEVDQFAGEVGDRGRQVLRIVLRPPAALQAAINAIHTDHTPDQVIGGRP